MQHEIEMVWFENATGTKEIDKISIQLECVKLSQMHESEIVVQLLNYPDTGHKFKS